MYVFLKEVETLVLQDRLEQSEDYSAAHTLLPRTKIRPSSSFTSIRRQVWSLQFLQGWKIALSFHNAIREP
ncbi:hypothetical protein M378DRAFT_167059 [Amanita muscaria Koide BX008]|uniref:Uncharacterized protein n=1 Tax=Amanita muscaria (strain Koide BX008) TaxID=946122 RepID=A0A0C2WX54_AMAMK|nr:hypothetical protein M378DRAFT_167059 [Amanita muscaria Koide BX008]